VAVVSALLTPELDRAALHLLGTALAGAASGALLRRMDDPSSGQRRRTLMLVLASGVGALVATIVAPPTGALAGTVELWIGVWAGTLFSAALLFGLGLEGLPDDRGFRIFRRREDTEDRLATRPVDADPADSRGRDEWHLGLIL
jgi:MFS family permease